MNIPQFKSRQIVSGIGFSILAATIFMVVRWAHIRQDDTSFNSDDLRQVQDADTGHRRLNQSLTTEIPLSTQFQLQGIITSNKLEDSVAILRDKYTQGDQHLRLGERLIDGGIVREMLVNSVILDRNGRLERVVLKTEDAHRSDNAKEENSPLQTTVSNLATTSDDRKQELPRVGLAPSNTQQQTPKKMPAADKRDSLRDRQIANSAKLPAYHLEQRNRMIVPQAPDTSVLDTPERSVPTARGNRLPTASYTPPQS